MAVLKPIYNLSNTVFAANSVLGDGLANRTNTFARAQIVGIVSDADVFFEIGANNVNATSNVGHFLPANSYREVRIRFGELNLDTNGGTHISFVQRWNLPANATVRVSGLAEDRY